MFLIKYNFLVYEDFNYWCNKLSFKILFMIVEDF